MLAHSCCAVIADEYVDRAFGTGALKITPAHDINDYNLGIKHNLDFINIFNVDATVNEVGGSQFTGLSREQCRKELWSALEGNGLAIKVNKAHPQRVPRSQRGGAVIEPRLSEQWFVRTEGLAERALKGVAEGRLKLVPSRFESEWKEWLGDIHDWCVSRQLWWGHRIPVYYVNGNRDQFVVVRLICLLLLIIPITVFIQARSAEEAMDVAKLKYGRSVSLQQEEDVLDTWFRYVLLEG
jgi:valyl-tRNA synthetase